MNKEQNFLRWVGAFAVLALALAGNTFAQELATLRVTVVDATGAIIPGVEITLKNTQTGATRTATTGDNGLAVMAGLPPGGYELTARTASFAPRTLPVQLSVGQVASLSVALGIQAREEKVEVARY